MSKRNRDRSSKFFDDESEFDLYEETDSRKKTRRNPRREARLKAEARKDLILDHKQWF